MTNTRAVVGLAYQEWTARRKRTTRKVSIRWVSSVSWGDGLEVKSVKTTADRAHAYEFTLDMACAVARNWRGTALVTR